jgi:nucleotide-binding universal stress UspA family protein
MFERILLPLDGSRMAEMAVPYAEYLARWLGSEITLFNSCSSDMKPYQHMHQVYLDNLAGEMKRRIGNSRPKRLPPDIRTEALVGKPVDVICDYANQERITMIVMAAFGGSGLKTWQLGSVADKIVRTVNVPTLLIRAENTRPLRGRKKLISRMLLPLDGSDASKVTIPYALKIAKTTEASINLFGMVERADYYSAHVSFIPYTEHMAKTYARMDATAEKNALAFLVGVEKELRNEGAHVTHAVTLGFSPAHDILEQEERTNADLVVMATRGSSGINHWAFGSVAEKVLRGGKLPLLLVKAEMQAHAIPSPDDDIARRLLPTRYEALVT